MSKRTQIDRFLMLKIKEGNKQAFDTLFMTYHHQIFLYCVRFIKSKEVAEEIMQDVFMIVWKKRAIIDAEQSLGGLLFKISKDLSLNYLKKEVREKCFMEAMQGSLQVSGNVTEDSVASDEYYRVAARAVGKLPTNQRLIFKMNRFMGFSYEAIGEKLGISINTVKVQLVRANKSVRKVLAAHGVYF
jgi:RNA polymerase sigma-70 factor (family 1)